MLSTTLTLALASLAAALVQPPHPTMPRISHGRLVDVYGERGPGDRTMVLRTAGTVIGADLPPQGGTDALFTYVGIDAGNGRPRVLIRCPVDTRPFAEAVAELRNGRAWLGVRRAHGAPPPIVRVPLGDAIEIEHAEAAVVDWAPRSGLRVVERSPHQIILHATPTHAAAGTTMSLVVDGIERARVRLDTPRRAPVPLALLTQVPMRLVSARPIDADVAEVGLFKAGVQHDIDAGDALRLEIAGQPYFATVLADPSDDRERPAKPFVTARVTPLPALLRADPRSRADYPAQPRSPAGRGWLRDNAPTLILLAVLNPQRDPPENGIAFDPPHTGPQPGDGVLPHASLQLRFNLPLDLRTLHLYCNVSVTQGGDGADGRRPVAVRAFVNSNDPYGLRLEPPLGFYLDERMREENAGRAFADKPHRMQLRLDAVDGLQSVGATALQHSIVAPFALDTSRGADGVPVHADNLVGGSVLR